MIRDDGALVAQVGALQEARHVFGSHASSHMGEVVRTRNTNAVYGFRVVYRPDGERIGLGLFQTQYGWWDPVSPRLVAQAVQDLGVYLRARPDIEVRLAYQRGVDLGAFSSLEARIRKRITVVERTRPPPSMRGFAPVEGFLFNEEDDSP